MRYAIRRTVAALLAIALALSMLPAPALAQMGEEEMGEEPAPTTSTRRGETSNQGTAVGDAGLAPMTDEGADALAIEELSEEIVVEQDEPEAVEVHADGDGGDGESELSTQSVGRLYNPRIATKPGTSSGKVVTWDCVWLGSYPQTEVAETSALRNASWSGGDATVGGVRYRRLSRGDVIAKENWGSSGYRYFRYEPIKWRILKVSGNTALAVSDVALDCKQYHKDDGGVTWATSTIRSWLNGTGTAPYYSSGAQSGRTAEGFATVAFTSSQLGAVRWSSVANANNTQNGTLGGSSTTDRVFLLSESEVHGASATAHGFASSFDTRDEARRCVPADYALTIGAFTDNGGWYDGNCYWWLRSPGSGTQFAVHVSDGGNVLRSGYYTAIGNIAVRPALQLDLSSSQLSWAGTVSSDGVVNTGASPGSAAFPDVEMGDWYEGVVYRAVGLGLLIGYKNGNFGPNDKITRGQAAVVLWKVAGQPAADAGARDFPDVRSGDYFRDAVRWASGAGVVNGYANGRFGPNDPVSREQLATMMANYVQRVEGWSISASIEDFAWMADKDEVSPWAVTPVGWCFQNEILSGAGGRVNPKGSATRAEAAKMVVNLHEILA